MIGQYIWLIKIAGALALSGTIWYYVNDYKNLGEFKKEASITMAKQELVIEHKDDMIAYEKTKAKDDKERTETFYTEVATARKEQEEAEIDGDQLDRVLSTERFGREESEGNTLLSTRMTDATEKLFDEIEQLSEIHGQ